MTFARAWETRRAARARGGFTIVELLMVVGIIGVLLGIATTAALGSLKTARAERAEALCKIVEQGLATYYAQKDKWPGPVGDKIASGTIGARSNNEGQENSSDNARYILTAAETHETIREIVKETASGNPLLDISGLFVSEADGLADTKKHGRSLSEAVHGTKRNPQRMTLGQMKFGYADPSTGYFRHFKIVYSIPTDEMKVSMQ